MKILFPQLLLIGLLPILIPVDCNTGSAWAAECSQCCYPDPDQNLARAIAPLLARQCQDCRLFSAASCSPIQYGPGTMQTALIRYTLRLPDGTVATHCAHMMRGSSYEEWFTRLYPVDSILKPDCEAVR